MPILYLLVFYRGLTTCADPKDCEFNKFEFSREGQRFVPPAQSRSAYEHAIISNLFNITLLTTTASNSIKHCRIHLHFSFNLTSRIFILLKFEYIIKTHTVFLCLDVEKNSLKFSNHITQRT